MKKVVLHIMYSLLLISLSHTEIDAQNGFKTIVTKGPITVGESFQVQYVLEDFGTDSEFFAPDFKEFRFVSGPNIYNGSEFGTRRNKKIKNIVYTLAALKPGKFIIPAASARIENKLIRGGQSYLNVISSTDAFTKIRKLNGGDMNDDTFLDAAEDVYAKIHRNLFIKVFVDKKTCFVGEPVTAVFKLFSRLNSKSDIVKNPGFYGFTVQDVINTGNKQADNIIIHGKEFDVHTIRKVQLYPLRAGRYTIDAMEVENKVKFSKSMVNKKAEQVIIEGVVPGDIDMVADKNSTIVESKMATEAVNIIVKPGPKKNKPSEYNGATGNFKIHSSLRKNELSKNEDTELIVTLSGKGNFTQLSAPLIDWPDGFEVFESKIIDSLDYNHSPMKGKREFHYQFISSIPGTYDLPEVAFCFFNTDSTIYKTIYTQPVQIKIRNATKSFGKVKEKNKNNPGRNSYSLGWLALFVSLAALVLVSYRRLFHKPAKTKPVPNIPEGPTISDILQSAFTFSAADNKTFYDILRNCIWNFFTLHFGLSGSDMNKSSLLNAMEQQKLDEKSKAGIMKILEQCENGLFSLSEDAVDKMALLEKTKDLMETIQK